MTFGQRLIGAIRLDPRVYEDVEADRSAGTQALLVVLASSFSAALGTPGVWRVGPMGFIVAMGLEVVAWVAWAFLIYYLGTRLFPGRRTQATPGELLRTLGFAAAPGLARALHAIPVIRPLVFTLLTAWMIAAMVVAVRQALDYDTTTRALVVCGAGWLLSFAIFMVLGIWMAPVLE
jgi:hypothetical protein